MGSTIRRQPLISKVPSINEDSIKYQNITNFKGLQISDSPFSVNVNSASDILNLYVNEYNILTTRPRIERKVSVTDKNVISVVPLSNNRYFYQCDDYFYILSGDTFKTVTNSEDYIVTNKVSIFEKNNKIYVLNGDSYGYIYYDEPNYIMLDVKDDDDTYIPIRYSRYANEEVSELEELNLLSDKYKTEIFWDGSISIDDLVSDSDSYENKYVVETTETQVNTHDILKTNGVDKIYGIGTHSISSTAFSSYTIYIQHGEETPVEVVTLTNINGVNNNLDLLYGEGAIDNDVILDCDESFDTIYLYNNSASGNIYKYVNNSGTITTSSFFSSGSGGTIFNTLKVSPNGLGVAISGEGLLYISYNDFEEVSNTGFLLGYTDDYILIDNGRGDIEKYNYSYLNGAFTIDSSPTILYSGVNFRYISYDNRYIIGEITDFWLSIDTYYEIYTTYNKTIDYNNIIINNIGEIIAFDNFGIYKITNDIFYKISTSTYDNLIKYIFYKNDNIILYKKNNSVYNGLLSGYYPDGENDKIYTELSSYDLYTYTDSDYYELLTSSELTDRWYEEKITINVYFNSSYPLLTITNTITSDDTKYADWVSLRNLLSSSLYHTRFNNEYWFVKNNYVFISNTNNPTYFPISLYNVFGNDDTDVTGFNNISDEVLAVYKENKTYFVSINDTYKYIINEAKAEQGNIAVNQSIVTSETELPLQIMNDGIYALSQTDNIATSNTIASSLTININPKFWNESNKTSIITQNWKYWTLFYLNNSMYILDNRTNEWFYWTIPFDLVSFWTEDSILYTADTEGNIYYFTEGDITNQFSGISEYYDYGEIIIPWYWVSQLLYLKTINYMKKLKNTTFHFTDGDSEDEYGLNYSFTVYRKYASEVGETTINDTLNYIASITKRTFIPKFNFIKVKLSNIEDDYDNNKLNLIGLSLKYQLMEVRV